MGAPFDQRRRLGRRAAVASIAGGGRRMEIGGRGRPRVGAGACWVVRHLDGRGRGHESVSAALSNPPAVALAIAATVPTRWDRPGSRRRAQPPRREWLCRRSFWETSAMERKAGGTRGREARSQVQDRCAGRKSKAKKCKSGPPRRPSDSAAAVEGEAVATQAAAVAAKAAVAVTHRRCRSSADLSDPPKPIHLLHPGYRRHL